MDVGLFLVTQYDCGRSLAGIADELRTQVELARDGGFAAIHVGEHHVTEEHQYLLNEPVVASIAEHIGDMELATGMCLLPLHEPVRVAEFGATMDVLTGGQFALGVAQGYRAKEYEALGVDQSEGTARFEEGLEIIKRLWREESVTFDGKFFQFENISLNPRPERPPRILVGASNPSSIRRAAHEADGWVGAHVPRAKASAQATVFREERGDDDGFVGLAREVFVADTTEAAEAAVKDHLMAKYASYSDWGQDDVISGDNFDSPWDKLRQERFLVGTPAEAVEELEHYEEAVDPDFLVCRTQFPGMDPADIHRSIQLIADEVIPEVS